MDRFKRCTISTSFRTFHQWLWEETFSSWTWKLRIIWLMLLWAYLLFPSRKPEWSWHPEEGRRNRARILIEQAPQAWPTSELSSYISQSFPQATLSWVLLPPMKAYYWYSPYLFLLHIIFLCTSFIFPIVPINFLRPIAHRTYLCICPRCIYTYM